MDIPWKEMRAAGVMAFTADGNPHPLLNTGAGFALLLSTPSAYQVTLQRREGWEDLRVCPESIGVGISAHGDSLSLDIPVSRSILLEVAGQAVGYIVVIPETQEPPLPSTGGTLHRFVRGEKTDAGTIMLQSGDVLWIETGACVRGHVVATESENIVIGGGGVLDASYLHPSGEGVRAVVIDNCRNVTLDNLTIINGNHWMVSIGNSDDVRISRMHQFSTGRGTDGIDVVGSRQVTVSDCFLRNGDDNLVIKALNVKQGAFQGQSSAGDFLGNWDAPVSGILFERCAIYNDHGGSAMEIGYETRADRISDVTFRDIEVMGVHQFGSVFGIHNGDRAVVENILWENIRVDHHYDKLVDIRVLHSRWNFDRERGCIRKVAFRNIQVNPSIYNEGYTVSLLGGYDSSRPVEGITFDRFRLGDKPVLCEDDLQLFTRHARNLQFHHP